MPSSLFSLRAGGKHLTQGHMSNARNASRPAPEDSARALHRCKSVFEARCPNHGEFTALDRGRSAVGRLCLRKRSTEGRVMPLVMLGEAREGQRFRVNSFRATSSTCSRQGWSRSRTVSAPSFNVQEGMRGWRWTWGTSKTTGSL